MSRSFVRLLAAVAVGLGGQAGDAPEELAEERLAGEVQSVADLLYGQGGGFQHGLGFHDDEAVYPFRCALPAVFLDDGRQVACRDVQPSGIEGHLAFMGIMLMYFADEPLHQLFAAGEFFVLRQLVEVRPQSVEVGAGEVFQGFGLILPFLFEQPPDHVAVCHQGIELSALQFHDGIFAEVPVHAKVVGQPQVLYEAGRHDHADAVEVATGVGMAYQLAGDVDGQVTGLQTVGRQIDGACRLPLQAQAEAIGGQFERMFQQGLGRYIEDEHFIVQLCHVFLSVPQSGPDIQFFNLSDFHGLYFLI